MKPKFLIVSAVTGLALLNSGCGETPGGSPSVASVTSVTSPNSAPPPTSEAETGATSSLPATSSAGPPASWTMPNLVDQNLQAAQDAVQALTGNPLFFTSSTDATGQGRAQVLDSNWKVCSQSVKPGDVITATTRIEFAAVKLDERCP